MAKPRPPFPEERFQTGMHPSLSYAIKSVEKLLQRHLEGDLDHEGDIFSVLEPNIDFSTNASQPSEALSTPKQLKENKGCLQSCTETSSSSGKKPLSRFSGSHIPDLEKSNLYEDNFSLSESKLLNPIDIAVRRLNVLKPKNIITQKSVEKLLQRHLEGDLDHEGDIFSVLEPNIDFSTNASQPSEALSTPKQLKENKGCLQSCTETSSSSGKKPLSRFSGSHIPDLEKSNLYEDNFSLSESKLLNPIDIAVRRLNVLKPKNIITQKSVEKLLQRHLEGDLDHEGDIFSVLEPNIDFSTNASQPSEALSTPKQLKENKGCLQSCTETSSSSGKKPLSRFSGSHITDLVSPPVLKKVKNRVLHEKYVNQLRFRRLNVLKPKNIITQKSVEKLLQRHLEGDLDREGDIFSVLEPNIDFSTNASQPSEALSTPKQLKENKGCLQSCTETSSSSGKKPLSRFSGSHITDLVSPPVLKKVKNRVLHEKYVNQLRFRRLNVLKPKNIITQKSVEKLLQRHLEGDLDREGDIFSVLEPNIDFSTNASQPSEALSTPKQLKENKGCLQSCTETSSSSGKKPLSRFSGSHITRSC
ncbi:unnamed protein product [Sphenostylis stenocarpa]|uniref:Uncharacterized protein n=1 Tax=Sphenostylis stenocarpa TaxID=92480 RepID=A0AA86S6Z8_9FABA|nr:unnamed protein product [Sphenostylis stenocarpa]